MRCSSRGLGSRIAPGGEIHWISNNLSYFPQFMGFLFLYCFLKLSIVIRGVDLIRENPQTLKTFVASYTRPSAQKKC